MRDGAPLIYQAQFFDGRWQGRATSCGGSTARRSSAATPTRCSTRSSRAQVKPHVVHQLCLYNRLLAAVQGFEPELAYRRARRRTRRRSSSRRYAALHRHVVAPARAASSAASRRRPTPSRRALRRSAGSPTSAARAGAPTTTSASSPAPAASSAQRSSTSASPPSRALADAPRRHSIAASSAQERFDLLRHQAGLQVDSRDDAASRPTATCAGARRAATRACPSPSAGDIFFDLEGDPYVGTTAASSTSGAGGRADGGYDCVWAHDERRREGRARDVHRPRRRAPRAASRPARLPLRAARGVQAPLARDQVRDARGRGRRPPARRRARRPLRRRAPGAAGRRGELLAQEARAPPRLRAPREDASARAAARSSPTRPGSRPATTTLLEAIRAYNEEDCRSTPRSARLAPRRRCGPRPQREFGVDFAELASRSRRSSTSAPEWLRRCAGARSSGSRPGCRRTATTTTPTQAERRLLVASAALPLPRGQAAVVALLRPARRRRPSSSSTSATRVGLLELDTSVDRRSRSSSRSTGRYTFPPQEFKLGAGRRARPDDRQELQASSQSRTTTSSCAAARTSRAPAPAALDRRTADPASTVLREALIDARRVAARRRRRASPPPGRMLRREPPRLDVGRARPRTSTQLDRRRRSGSTAPCCPSRDRPGTGKTYRGARMIVAALAGRPARRRSPPRATPRSRTSCATSRTHAHETGVHASRASTRATATRARTASSTSVDDERGDRRRRVPARRRHRLAVRPRASTASSSTCSSSTRPASSRSPTPSPSRLRADSVVLLGDPQQLPQVNQADHPDGVGRLRARAPARRRRHRRRPAAACCSTETWRMHPDVCAFVSERSYDGRLRSRDACALRRIDAGRARSRAPACAASPSSTTGRSQASPEEADAIAAACRDAARRRHRDRRRTARRAPLEAADIMVVAPYNLAVALHPPSACPTASASAPSTRSRARRRPSSSSR